MFMSIGIYMMDKTYTWSGERLMRQRICPADEERRIDQIWLNQ